MINRRIVGANAHGPLRRLTRLLSLLVISSIGLGIIQSGCDTAPEDETNQDERVAFRHFV